LEIVQRGPHEFNCKLLLFLYARHSVSRPSFKNDPMSVMYYKNCPVNI
jgi:hypothetical protein